MSDDEFLHRLGRIALDFGLLTLDEQPAFVAKMEQIRTRAPSSQQRGPTGKYDQMEEG